MRPGRHGASAGRDQTESDADGADGSSRLLLDQTEAHRQQRQSDDKVEGAQDELLLGPPGVRVCSRNVVAEADRRQSDETEIAADQKVPVAFFVTA